MKTIQRKCPTCGQNRLYQKTGVNHILHVILSLVTLGLWLPVWVLLLLVNALAPYRCSACGNAKTL